MTEEQAGRQQITSSSSGTRFAAPRPVAASHRKRGIYISHSMKDLSELKRQMEEYVRLIEACLPKAAVYIDVFGSTASLDKWWDQRGLSLALAARKLRQQLRLINFLISKVRLTWRAALSSKKAVSERHFFVLHETHPPAVAANDCGRFPGAFQTA